ncbi:phosphate signaling complex protein PhoU [soil metagenome]
MTRIGYASSLQGVRDATLALSSMVDKAIADAIKAFEEWNPDAGSAVVSGDDRINDARWHLEEEVILIIARQAPMASDLRQLISVIHIATELERIGDYAKVVGRTVADFPDKPGIAAIPRIVKLGALGREQLAGSMEAFVERNAAMARRVAKNDEKLDTLWIHIYRQLLAEMIADPDLVTEASSLLSIAHNFERMGDRITNICERIIYIATGEFEENVHLEAPDADLRG